MLPKRRGAILFTGASASVKGYAQSAPFAMGKFALRGLAQSMARELRPAGHPRRACGDRRRHQAASAARSRPTSPRACSIPTRSPRAICTSSISRTAPGPGRSSCGRGSRGSRPAVAARRRARGMAAARRHNILTLSYIDTFECGRRSILPTAVDVCACDGTGNACCRCPSPAKMADGRAPARRAGHARRAGRGRGARRRAGKRVAGRHRGNAPVLVRAAQLAGATARACTRIAVASSWSTSSPPGASPAGRKWQALELQSRLEGKPFAIVPISVAEADGSVRRFFAADPPPLRSCSIATARSPGRGISIRCHRPSCWTATCDRASSPKAMSTGRGPT